MLFRRGHQSIGNPINAAKITDNKSRILTTVLARPPSLFSQNNYLHRPGLYEYGGPILNRHITKPAV